MLLDPADTNWRDANDSEVLYAARDGVRQAQAELRRREAMVQAVGTEDAQRGAMRKAMKNLRNT